MATSEERLSSPTKISDQDKEIDKSPVYDVLCIGFGATGVALAVAFNDQNPNLKIQFVEQQSRRSWKPFAQSAGERMRTSFLDDLITWQILNRLDISTLSTLTGAPAASNIKWCTERKYYW